MAPKLCSQMFAMFDVLPCFFEDIMLLAVEFRTADFHHFHHHHHSPKPRHLDLRRQHTTAASCFRSEVTISEHLESHVWEGPCSTNNLQCLVISDIYYQRDRKYIRYSQLWFIAESLWSSQVRGLMSWRMGHCVKSWTGSQDAFCDKKHSPNGIV